MMALFLVFAIATLLDEDFLAGDGRYSINDRGTQVVVAISMLALVAWMLPGALLALLDHRPAVHLDEAGGVVRAVVRRRRYRWDDVVAIDGGPKAFTIRLARGRPIRVAGEFEGHDLPAIYACALALWLQTPRT